MSISAEDCLHQQEDEEDILDDGSWLNAELFAELLERNAIVLSVSSLDAADKQDKCRHVCYNVNVQYHNAESEEVREKKFFTKGLPAAMFLRKYIEERGFFRREISVYDDMLPRLYAFADAALGNGSFKRFSAAFYKTSRPDTVIVDDLKAQEFLLAPRRERLDLAHSKLVVQSLARLHALSVAYDEKNPGNIAQYPDIMYSESNKNRLSQFLPQQPKSILAEIKNWEGSDNIIKKLEALQEVYLDKVMDVCNAKKCRRTVLIHGDCWVDNIFFKYSETGHPIDIRFVDFELCREASPGLDLNYFLFTSPRTDVRLLHFDNLLQEYCYEFGRCAAELGYSGAPFTFEEIRKEVDRTALFGFMKAAWMLPVVLAEPVPETEPEKENVTGGKVEKEEMRKSYQSLPNPAFREAFESMFSYFEECGALE